MTTIESSRSTALSRGALVVAILAIVQACSGACSGATSRLPRPMRRYEATHEVQPYLGRSIPGVALWQATPRDLCCDQESTIVVVGIDPNGSVVPARELLRRLGPLSAEELVRPVSDIVLGRPFIAIHPGDAQLSSDFVTPAEAALVTPPTLEGTRLTYFAFAGTMHPDLVRIRVDLTTATFESTYVSTLVPPPAADGGVASGAPGSVEAIPHAGAR